MEPLVVPVLIVIYIEERVAPPPPAVFQSRKPYRSCRECSIPHPLLLWAGPGHHARCLHRVPMSCPCRQGQGNYRDRKGKCVRTGNVLLSKFNKEKRELGLLDLSRNAAYKSPSPKNEEAEEASLFRHEALLISLFIIVRIVNSLDD